MSEANDKDKKPAAGARPADAAKPGGSAKPTESVAAADKLGLEEIVHLANKIGLEYAAAKKAAERFELLKPTVRARVSLRLDNGEISEARLRRLTETDKEYVDFIEGLAEAKGESDRLRIRYESYKNLFEARRSLLSYQKAEMKLL